MTIRLFSLWTLTPIIIDGCPKYLTLKCLLSLVLIRSLSVSWSEINKNHLPRQVILCSLLLFFVCNSSNQTLIGWIPKWWGYCLVLHSIHFLLVLVHRVILINDRPCLYRPHSQVLASCIFVLWVLHEDMHLLHQIIWVSNYRLQSWLAWFWGFWSASLVQMCCYPSNQFHVSVKNLAWLSKLCTWQLFHFHPFSLQIPICNLLLFILQVDPLSSEFPFLLADSSLHP